MILCQVDEAGVNRYNLGYDLMGGIGRFPSLLLYPTEKFRRLSFA